MGKSTVRKQIGRGQGLGRGQGTIVYWGWGLLLGFNRGDVCTAVNVLNATELYTLKWLCLC